MKKLLLCLVFTCTFFITITPIYSAGVPQEIGSKTLLTIKGKLKSGTTMEFNLDELMRLPQTEFKVTSRRTHKQDVYQGVSLIDLLDSTTIANTVSVVEVIAENDYRALIKIEDIKRYEYLLAYKKNGLFYWDLELSENKGPLAIAINFDKYPQMDWEIYKHQLVWFVKEIIVK